MKQTKQLSASLEDYLETIFFLVEEHTVARAKDIAAKMEVSKASVTGALRELSSRGFINYDPYSVVTLTAAGRKTAEEITRRHHALVRFLSNVLKVRREDALDNACRMEHAVNKRVIDRLVSFINYLETSPATLRRWHRRRSGKKAAKP